MMAFVLLNGHVMRCPLWKLRVMSASKDKDLQKHAIDSLGIVAIVTGVVQPSMDGSHEHQRDRQINW
jgi:hypothetical protein